MAIRHARAGDQVACVDRDAARASATAASLPGTGHADFVADVGDDASMEALRDAVLARWGGVDVLYNNAGIASGGCMAATTMDEWRRLLDINLLGVVRGCLAFLPGMLAQKGGHILNTASFAGLAGAPNMMTYGVSKAAVVALSEQLRAELIDEGVKVSVICPAFFQTNLLESWQGDPRMKKFGEKMMTHAVDTLDSVADAVFASAQRGEFLILPTRQEPMRWRLKRWLPGLYFRKLRAMAAGIRGKQA
ncbi:SDR family NAD(P)-dependent oxidoreductase [Lysobacter sp. CAU 1642]|uniref:SDR family NAD(P)-dependent oxidoreductase n=2 Tax=Pseudomarimonas salicorniae TaxID=2933270 RepID=A0ABT0GIM9_9GAMM|nr:SDR family NAD(P)-dependent oxidoreductase [Lysobacter sp. CAU 1642]